MSVFDEFRALRPFGGFDLIMADPPWHYEMRSEKGEAKSPQAHYATMNDAEIAALPVEMLAAPNCLLWLWAVGPKLPAALAVMAAWGFTFKTQGQWAKTTKHGKQHFGTGYILRNAGEPVLIGTRGDPFLIGTRGNPKTTRGERNVFFGLTREHSRKPEEGYALAERLMPDAKRIELFSRTSRAGWAAWGNEAGKFDEVAL